MTDEAYREILAEVYTAGGELIGSTVSEYGTNYGQTNWFWDENSPGGAAIRHLLPLARVVILTICTAYSWILHSRICPLSMKLSP